MKRFALIVAGGKGLRMGNDTPKQFLLLKGRPVLMHTINTFYQTGCEIILVIPEAHFSYWEELCKEHHFETPHKIVQGGDERFYSVKNGLKTIEQEGLVAIHDGVRPCISSRIIEQSFKDAETFGSAVVAVKPKDSIRMKQGDTTTAVNRNDYFLVQTPQTFKLDEIKKAYDTPYSLLFTDDASVFENTGKQVHITAGDYRNIKITTPEDLELAALFV